MYLKNELRLKNSTSPYELAQLLFLIGIFMKQFYLGASGGFQIGDLCFMACALCVVYCSKGVIEYHSEDRYIFIYAIFIVAINAAYFYLDSVPDSSGFYYTKSILYYIYNLIIIFTFQIIIDDDFEFLLKVQKILKICIFVQAIVVLFHLGGSTYGRSMGTFNDPNQCAFYVFASCLIIFIISYIFEQKGTWQFWYFLSFFIIVNTQSTGMLMGLLLLLGLFLAMKLRSTDVKIFGGYAAAVGVCLLVYILLSCHIIDVPEQIQQSSAYARTVQKIGILSGEGSGRSGIYGIAVDRCWDRLLNYPEKLLYGAGEGNFTRFPSARYVNNEIHSSILGPLFYYGIIPCGFWLYWMYLKFKDLKPEIACALIALLVESLTLVNVRQPFFWMIFVLCGYEGSKKQCGNEKFEIN